MNELRERLRADGVTGDTEAELTEKLEREASFQYYLFEQALLDSAIDPAQLADIDLIGEPLELTPEVIKKERAAWAASPVQRHTMPILTEVTHMIDEDNSEMTEEKHSEDE